MTLIIPPQRDELISDGDEVTQRYIKFFESLANLTTSTSTAVEDTVNISEVAAAARFATRGEVEEIRSQLVFLKSFILSQVEPKTQWVGPWTENTLYKKGQQVIQCGWLAIANTTTLARAAPQLYGSPYTAFDNDAAAPFTTETALSVNAVALGVRYDGDAYNGVLNQIRFFTVTASTDYFYDFWLIDETGQYCCVADQLQFSATGWHTIELSQRAIVHQSHFDLVCIVTNHDAGSSTFNAPYHFSVESGAPGVGEMRQQPNGWELRINYEDQATNDQTTNLQTLVTGDVINFTGHEWRVVDVESTAGAYITLRVTPAIKATDGLYGFIFTHYTATDIDYPRIVNTYNGNPDVVGYVDTDSDGSGASTDDNSYGVDVFFLPAHTSPDWDLQAFE